VSQTGDDAAPDLRGNRFIVANPNVPVEALQEFLDAIGAESETWDDADLFPRRPWEGPCRVCGTIGPLTEEHLPPRGAFNKERGRIIDPISLLGRDEIDPEVDGPVHQGGIRGYTLCASCNSFTGSRWGREYQEWAMRSYILLCSLAQQPPELDDQPIYPFIGSTFTKVYPGRFVRQVLSMMATVSGGPELCERYPVLRNLILGGEPQPLPAPLRLYFLLYGSPTSRIAGGPEGQVRYTVGIGAQRVLAVDFRPMAFVLLLEGEPLEAGLEISNFTEKPVDALCDYSFEEIQLGFGHKPWPLDYRTRGRMLADREEPEF